MLYSVTYRQHWWVNATLQVLDMQMDKMCFFLNTIMSIYNALFTRAFLYMHYTSHLPHPVYLRLPMSWFCRQKKKKLNDTGNLF